MFLMIGLLILSLLVIVLIDVPRLVRQRLWKELLAFSLLLVIGYTLAFLRVLEIQF